MNDAVKVHAPQMERQEMDIVKLLRAIIAGILLLAPYMDFSGLTFALLAPRI